jgi:SNF family Na+-dependent transporter
VVCLVLVAMPLYMMELIMGQHTRLSTVPCFTMIRPRWRGLGYAQALLVAYALSYYNVLLAYAVIYIVGALIERFWNERVLNKYPNDPGGGELGPLQGKIVGALFFVWFLVRAARFELGVSSKFLSYQR